MTHLFLITGQSLATGRAPAMTVDPVAQDHALCFDGGPVGGNGQPLTARLGPLRETGTETIASGFAAQLLKTSSDPLILAGQGWAGQPYAVLRKGGPSHVFEQVIAQAQMAKTHVPEVQFGAILVLHGETDGAQGTAEYDRILAQWHQDFASALSDIFDTTEPMPMLLCQTSSISGYCSGDRRHFRTPQMQFQAALTHPQLVLVGPKYQYDYIDWAHIDAASTRRHGALFAKAYRRLAQEGKGWHPLQPRRLTHSDNSVLIDFDVPVEPLCFDTEHVRDPGQYGFSLHDPQSRIIAVEPAGPSRIRLVLDRPPARSARVSYALYNGTSGRSGRLEGARGCLRDSDTEQCALDDSPLFNWSVAFDLPIEWAHPDGDPSR